MSFYSPHITNPAPENVRRFSDDAETFEARTTRKSLTDPFVEYDEFEPFSPKTDTDELREDVAGSKMVSVPDGKHLGRGRYERVGRKKKGHKRQNNPKKTDYDNQTLGQDFFKKRQQGKDDMRNNAEYHRDSKGRFSEKPVLAGSVVGGLALGLMYFMGRK